MKVWNCLWSPYTKIPKCIDLLIFAVCVAVDQIGECKLNGCFADWVGNVHCSKGTTQYWGYSQVG